MFFAFVDFNRSFLKPRRGFIIVKNIQPKCYNPRRGFIISQLFIKQKIQINIFHHILFRTS